MTTTHSPRSPPHCRTCHKPVKGHSRELCNLIMDVPKLSLSEMPNDDNNNNSPTRRRPRTRQSGPLPALSPQSSLILHNLLRANSSLGVPSASVVSTPQHPSARLKNKKKHKGDQETLQDTLSRIYDEEQELSDEKEKAQNSIHISIDVVHHLKLEEDDGSSSSISDDISSADLAINNFLESMSTNPDNPPASLFSFPIDTLPSLQKVVLNHSLHILICSLPEEDNKSKTKVKDGWVPVVVGRNLAAIAELLEDGEKLAAGLRRPDKFKPNEWDLGIRHVVVSALGGALATWAGLAYC